MRRQLSYFTHDFQTTSYWWETALRPTDSAVPLPPRADVVVIGGGIAGLNAARIVRRTGLSVALLEADSIGHAAASRNLGFVVTRAEGAFTAPFDAAVGGLPVLDWIEEARTAGDELLETIQDIGCDCDVREDGKLVLATNESAFKRMSDQVSRYRDRFPGWTEHMIKREELSAEIGGNASDQYVGAKLQPSATMINPAKLVVGLHDACVRGGVSLHANTTASALERTGAGGWNVITPRGSVSAAHVIVTAMGSVGPQLPEAYRRTFPFLAHVIATEPIDPELVRTVLPKLRGCVDTRQMFYNFRPSPDGRRLVFACDYLRASPPHVQALAIRERLVRLFPSLRSVKISHCWGGSLALTRDHLPHIATEDGITWCIAGHIAMAVHLAVCAARVAIGHNPQDIRLLSRASPTYAATFGRPSNFRVPLRLVLKALDACGVSAPK